VLCFRLSGVVFTGEYFLSELVRAVLGLDSPVEPALYILDIFLESLITLGLESSFSRCFFVMLVLPLM